MDDIIDDKRTSVRDVGVKHIITVQDLFFDPTRVGRWACGSIADTKQDVLHQSLISKNTVLTHTMDRTEIA